MHRVESTVHDRKMSSSISRSYIVSSKVPSVCARVTATVYERGMDSLISRLQTVAWTALSSRAGAMSTVYEREMESIIYRSNTVVKLIMCDRLPIRVDPIFSLYHMWICPGASQWGIGAPVGLRWERFSSVVLFAILLRTTSSHR